MGLGFNKKALRKENGETKTHMIIKGGADSQVTQLWCLNP
jgi:hypothetical protein